MNAEIISVGTELLLGEILNTDAQFLARRLSETGIDVYYQTVVGDNRQRLSESVRCALERADIVIASGGLGPTPDDLTKEVLSECMGEELVMHEESLEEIKGYFRAIGHEMAENNKKQAMMPKNAIILKNNNGTAPGAIIEKNGKIVIMLPGPPNELEPMFNESVLPYLKSKSEYILYSRVLQIFGMGEAMVASKLEDMMNEYENPTVAPYAKTAGVRLRITAKCKSEEEGIRLTEPVEKKIKEILGDVVYGYGDETIQEALVRLLAEKGLTISAAESCTGGCFAGMITDVAGASGVLNESVVTYANSAKMKYLGVREDTLARFGAVSEQTAKEMAEGIRKAARADIGIGITGIAGPGGASADKPVGLVYIGAASKSGTTVKRITLKGNREKIRHQACVYALDAARRAVLDMAQTDC
ncbi:MAG: competence/damage-inducible protein A [Oscillospiraceae bacterium]|nr:competence/damage-inducible protein A [Oscillospiraceae bacterium]